MGKKRKKAWQDAPLWIFWIVWKERNSRVFQDKGLTIQRVKQSFLCNLWDWVNMFIDPKANSVVDFIDLIDYLMECFCAISFLVVLVGTLCMLPVYLWALLGVSLLMHLFLLIKNKKKIMV